MHVDVSIVPTDAGMLVRVNAMAKLRAVADALGPLRVKLLEFVVVKDLPWLELARLLRGTDKTAVGFAVEAIEALADWRAGRAVAAAPVLQVPQSAEPAVTHVHLRNMHPTRRCLVPMATGRRDSCPAVTSCLPAGVVELPAVRRMLAAQVLAVVDVTGWDAEARQRQVDRLGMEAAIRHAEQREFDQWRQRRRPRRIHRPPNRNRKRRADEWPPAWIERLRRRWTEGAGAEQIAASSAWRPAQCLPRRCAWGCRLDRPATPGRPSGSPGSANAGRTAHRPRARRPSSE